MRSENPEAGSVLLVVLRVKGGSGYAGSGSLSDPFNPLPEREREIRLNRPKAKYVSVVNVRGINNTKYHSRLSERLDLRNIQRDIQHCEIHRTVSLAFL